MTNIYKRAGQVQQCSDSQKVYRKLYYIRAACNNYPSMLKKADENPNVGKPFLKQDTENTFCYA